MPASANVSLEVAVLINYGWFLITVLIAVASKISGTLLFWWSHAFSYVPHIVTKDCMYSQNHSHSSGNAISEIVKTSATSGMHKQTRQSQT